MTDSDGRPDGEGTGKSDRLGFRPGTTGNSGVLRGFSGLNLMKDYKPFGDMFKPVDMTPKYTAPGIEKTTFEPIHIPPRPDPGLLRTLIEETQKSNQQSARLIEQNDLLLAGARSGGRISGWGLVFTIVGTATGVAGVVIAIIALTA